MKVLRGIQAEDFLSTESENISVDIHNIESECDLHDSFDHKLVGEIKKKYRRATSGGIIEFEEAFYGRENSIRFQSTQNPGNHSIQFELRNAWGSGVNVASISRANVSNWKYIYIDGNYDSPTISVVEHPLSACFLTGVSEIRFILETYGVFSNSPTSINPIVSRFISNKGSSLMEAEHRFITVNEPIVVIIDQKTNQYMGFLPDENGDKVTTLDVSIDYPTSLPGKQRLRLQLNDEVAKYISYARSNFYGKNKIGRLLYKVFNEHLVKRNNKLYSLNKKNILYCNGEEYANPNEIFNLNQENSKNIEWGAHAFLDKCGELALLYGRLSGEIRTNKLSHRGSLKALKYLTKEGYFIEV